MLYLPLFFKGLILGITAIAPGISIGTMALSLNVYVQSLDYGTALLSKKTWKNTQQLHTICSFLIPILLGIAFAMFLGSRFLLWIFLHYSIYIKMIFLGLIFASIPYFFSHYLKKQFQFFLLFFFLIGFLLALVLGTRAVRPGADTPELLHSLYEYCLTFMYGAVAAAAGILPGISGSYILLIMGFYPTFLAILSSAEIIYLGFLIIGMCAGLVCAIVFIRYFLKRHPIATYAVILGIITGSMVKIFPTQEIQEQGFKVLTIVFFLIGVLIFVLTNYIPYQQKNKN